MGILKKSLLGGVSKRLRLEKTTTFLRPKIQNKIKTTPRHHHWFFWSKRCFFSGLLFLKGTFVIREREKNFLSFSLISSGFFSTNFVVFFVFFCLLTLVVFLFVVFVVVFCYHFVCLNIHESLKHFIWWCLNQTWQFWKHFVIENCAAFCFIIVLRLCVSNCKNRTKMNIVVCPSGLVLDGPAKLIESMAIKFFFCLSLSLSLTLSLFLYFELKTFFKLLNLTQWKIEKKHTNTTTDVSTSQ